MSKSRLQLQGVEGTLTYIQAPNTNNSLFIFELYNPFVLFGYFSQCMNTTFMTIKKFT